MQGAIVLLQLAAETLSHLQRQIAALDGEVLEQVEAPVRALARITEGDSPVDLMVLNGMIDAPIEFAQRVHALDKNIIVVILCPPEHHMQIQRAMQFAPFVGSGVVCRSTAEDGTLAAMLKQMLSKVRQRRSYRTMVTSSQRHLTTTPAPPPLPQQYLDRLFDYAPIGVLIVDRDGKLLIWNQHAQEIMGGRLSNARGTAFKEFLPDSQRQAFDDFVQELANSSGRLAPVTFELATANEPQCVEITGAVLNQRHHEEGLLLIIQDITLRRQAEREAENRRLQEQIIQTQAAALAELSTPLIPLNSQVVIMPLIGTMDSQRTQRAIETLLTGVSKHGAQIAILDITGVPIIDSHVASALLRAAQCVKLLGAQVVLTGMRPEVSQTLVGLGITLQGIIARGSLQSGILYALEQHPQTMHRVRQQRPEVRGRGSGVGQGDHKLPRSTS